MTTIAAHEEWKVRSDTQLRRTTALLMVAATVVWLASVTLGTTLDVEGAPHRIALVLHIMAMVAAFGAILLLDWHGFLWLIAHREISEVIRLDGAASPLVWGGLFGMMATGAFLNPDLGAPLTVIKLVAVLALTLNGITLIPLMHRLVRMPPDSRFSQLPMGQRVHMIACLSISQLCWWTAIAVGFVNAEL
jgi:hypothetical protein